MTTSLEILAEAGYMSWTDLHRSVKADADKITELQAALLKKDERIKEHEQFRHQHRDCDAISVENQRLRADVAKLKDDTAVYRQWHARDAERITEMAAEIARRESWERSILAEVGQAPPHAIEAVDNNWGGNGACKIYPARCDLHADTWIDILKQYKHYKHSAEHLAAKLVEAEQRIKAYEEADTSHLPYEKGWQDGRDDAWNAYQALAGQPAPKPQDEVTTMALCEVAHIVLHTDQLYRFVAVPGCTTCAELAKATPAPKTGEPT